MPGSLSTPQNRYEQLHAKLKAERELFDRTATALEDKNLQLREARAALQASESDADILRARLSRLDDTGNNVPPPVNSPVHPCFGSPRPARANEHGGS